MTTATKRLVVVGGGILGMMHAFEGIRRGYDVVQLERDGAPEGASVRNFGLIWVSGRAAGAELEFALEARDRWEAVAADAPGTGFRPIGSLTVARSKEELAVLAALADAPDAERRGVSLFEPEEARVLNPSLTGDLEGALFCERDAAVEPRLALGALRNYLARNDAYHFLPGHEVRDIGPHTVTDQYGFTYSGDLVVCCTGAGTTGVIGDALADAPLRRVRLQMLETERFEAEVTTSIADGDSLRYYPAFAANRDDLPPQDDIAAKWRAQLLLVRRLGGHLTIGDTHAYDEPFPFDIDDEPARHLMATAEAILGQQLPPIARRWFGIYCEVTGSDALYYRDEITPGVVVVNGPGGRGMTMAPAIAAATFA
jgi:FAD dependent oxidoreductase TIGR03364